MRNPRGTNAAEAAFCAWAREHGYNCTKRGWPDFFTWTEDGKLLLVEVKSSRSRRLKREQVMVLRALAAYGVPCYRWDPATGFLRVLGADPQLPADKGGRVATRLREQGAVDGAPTPTP